MRVNVIPFGSMPHILFDNTSNEAFINNNCLWLEHVKHFVLVEPSNTCSSKLLKGGNWNSNFEQLKIDTNKSQPKKNEQFKVVKTFECSTQALNCFYFESIS